MAYQSHLDDPEYWRDRAEQVRALADQVSNQTARDAILRIVTTTNFLLIGRKHEPSDSFWLQRRQQRPTRKKPRQRGRG